VLGELTIDQRGLAIGVPVVLTGDLAATPNNARKMPVEKSAPTVNARKTRKRFLERRRLTTESKFAFVFQREAGRMGRLQSLPRATVALQLGTSSLASPLTPQSWVRTI